MWKTLFLLRSDASHWPPKLELDACISIAWPEGWDQQTFQVAQRLDPGVLNTGVSAIQVLMLRARSDASILKASVWCLNSDEKLTRQDVDAYVKTLSAQEIQKLLEEAGL